MVIYYFVVQQTEAVGEATEDHHQQYSSLG